MKKCLANTIAKEIRIGFHESPELVVARRLIALGVTENALHNLRNNKVIRLIPDAHLLKVRNAIRDLERGFIS